MLITPFKIQINKSPVIIRSGMIASYNLFVNGRYLYQFSCLYKEIVICDLFQNKTRYLKPDFIVDDLFSDYTYPQMKAIDHKTLLLDFKYKDSSKRLVVIELDFENCRYRLKRNKVLNRDQFRNDYRSFLFINPFIITADESNYFLYRFDKYSEDLIELKAKVKIEFDFLYRSHFWSGKLVCFDEMYYNKLYCIDFEVNKEIQYEVKIPTQVTTLGSYKEYSWFEDTCYLFLQSTTKNECCLLTLNLGDKKWSQIVASFPFFLNHFSVDSEGILTTVVKDENSGYNVHRIPLRKPESLLNLCLFESPEKLRSAFKFASILN